MVVNELLKMGMTLIEEVEYSNPLLESILILSDILKVDKGYIYSHGEREIEKYLEDEFIKTMKKRSQNYPIAYLLGKKEFMGLDFYLEEGVLIPRPDTEIMIEYIIDYVKENYGDKEINILDIGTGSGAIALSIASFLPFTKVYGIDIDSLAIRISEKNKEILNIGNVNFYRGDLFGALDGLVDEKFQIIVSNPPYIKREDIEGLQRDVKDFEPLRALDGGKDGLDFYRRITRDSKEYLQDNGILIYEIGFNQGERVKDILEGQGFSNVDILKDLQGHDRVVFGVLNRGDD